MKGRARKFKPFCKPRRSSVPLRERDPSRMWLDYGECYVEIRDGEYWITDADELLAVSRGPEVLLDATILRYGDATNAGVLVASASAAWFEICKQIDRDPRFRFEFADNPRKFEEFVAGAYVESDFDEVTVTPRSGDRGRDVIAVKSGMCSVRILDQTKAYSLNRLVTHNDVRSILGVVAYTDVNTSKGVITTTSDFEPMIWSSGEFTPLMPYRVDLQNGDKLIQWLRHICEAKKQRRTA